MGIYPVGHVFDSYSYEDLHEIRDAVAYNKITDIFGTYEINNEYEDKIKNSLCSDPYFEDPVVTRGRSAGSSVDDVLTLSWTVIRETEYRFTLEIHFKGDDWYICKLKGDSIYRNYDRSVKADEIGGVLKFINDCLLSPLLPTYVFY